MGLLEAFIGIVIMIVIIAIIIPITQELLPTMIGDMGVTTGIMVSTTVLVIIVCTIIVFIRQSMQPDDHASIQGN